jgi:aminopeptidase Y
VRLSRLWSFRFSLIDGCFLRVAGDNPNDADDSPSCLSPCRLDHNGASLPELPPPSIESLRSLVIMKTLSVCLAILAVACAAPLEQVVLSRNKPLVDSDSLQKYIGKNGLVERAGQLYEIAKQSEPENDHPTRVIGSQGHNATVQYILDSLASFGDYYQVSTQAFNAISGSIASYSVQIDGTNITEATAFYMTPPTPKKLPVIGRLSAALNDGCKPSDFVDTAGTIALIKRGACPFGDKSELAGLSGALAAIIYNNEEGANIPGTLGTPLGHEVATVGISKGHGESLVKRVQAGEHINASVCVDSEIILIDTQNVVAETKSGDKENIVMLGAHSDSVGAGPGINDDGSGTLSLLEVAKALSNFEVNNTVRFAWWSAEEEGLLGSDFYASMMTADENRRIRLFMDYDMMASPNFAYQIYNASNDKNPAGSGELKQLYVDFYEKEGVNYTFVPFDGRSDYDGFLRAGIPSGGVATGAEELKRPEEVPMFGGKAYIAYDPCYHELCDNLTNVDYNAWVVNTKLIAHSVASYARSFEGFPVRTPLGVHTFDVESASAYKYHGPHLAF